MTVKPLARYAALNNFVELGLEAGLDPADLLREQGLDPASLDIHDRWVPAESVARLLERSADASGRQDFAVDLARRRRFSHLGPLSLVLREEPDVRSALTTLIRYQHMYNESLDITLSTIGGLTTVRVALTIGGPGDYPQSTCLAVTVLHQLLQGFLGPEWRPNSISLSRPEPADPAGFYRAFGEALSFGQAVDGISFYAHVLDEPNVMSDPLMRQYSKPFLEGFEPAPSSAASDRVRDLVEVLLPTGRCSVDQIAHSLSVDRRTIHRQLAAEGLTYSMVLNQTRTDLARRLVGTSQRSLTEISLALGFSSISTFSRWFKSEFGASPAAWRKS